jgi:hypothetical protein
VYALSARLPYAGYGAANVTEKMVKRLLGRTVRLLIPETGPGRISRTLLAPLLLVLAACDSAVTAPAAFNEERCAVPAALAASVYAHSFPATSLRPALLHAAGPMASVLGEGELTDELRASIALLGTASGPVLHDTHCRLVVIASAALRRMPDTPETLPDRDMIHLVLALLAHALVTERP